MKTIKLFIALMCCAGSLFAQTKLKFADSEVSFYSEAPLEDIAAINKGAIGVIDLKENAFLFRVPIKDFRFDKKLMEEHFNENYMESHKYPNASFRGHLDTPFDPKGPEYQEVNAIGDLEIHGIKIARKLPLVLQKKDGSWILKSTFNVTLEDHHITIPTVVFNKIAEIIEVKINGALQPL